MITAIPQSELWLFDEFVGPIHWSHRPAHRFVWTGQDWQEFVLSRTPAVHDPDGRQAAHQVSGIYALFADDELLYIGKSVDIMYRIRQHRKTGAIPFDCYAALPVPETAIREVEIAHIMALKPPHNVLREPPRWKGHSEMVTEIRRVWEPGRVPA